MRKDYTRRKFLGGVGGILVGLPFLETFAPKKALGQAGSAPMRFVGYFLPNGMDMDDWRPIGAGATFQLGPMMGAGGRVWNDGLPAYPVEEDGDGLSDLKDYLLVISGLQNTKQEGDVGDHSGGIGSMQTNRTVPLAVGATMGGPSIDYLVHTVHGQETRRPYFVLGGEPPFWQGDYCDSGYPCAVANHITFDMNGNNIPRIESPGEAFDQLFQGFDPAAEPMAPVDTHWMTNVSILDAVGAETEAMIPALSAMDRPRLDEYLTSIREVERRIQLAGGAGGGATCTLPERVDSFGTTVNGGSVSGDHRAAIDISHELMALGLQCGATNVESFMWGNMTSARNYSFIGAQGGHHDTSHHGGNADAIAKLKRIGYWEYRRFGDFLRRLKGMVDIDGRTVLDNTLVFQASDISDGDAHNHDDMPVVLAGGAAGFTMGQHLDAGGAWFGQLFLSIANAYGLGVTSFGEHGDSELPGLTA